MRVSQPSYETVPYESSRRSTVRGARVGVVLGLVAFAVSVVAWGLGSAREAVGMLIMTVSGGTTFGALYPHGSWFRRRPESKPKFAALLLAIGAVGMGGVVLGAFVAGITGSN